MNLDNWIEFGTIGLLLTAVLRILQTRSLSNLKIFIWCGLALSALILSAYFFENVATLGVKSSWYDESPAKELLYFGVMLLGMMARYLTKAIETRREKIEELRRLNTDFKKPSIEFDAWEFAYPFFISFITFGLLMSQMEKDTVNIPNIALSFQTGFFWQTILSAKQKI